LASPTPPEASDRSWTRGALVAVLLLAAAARFADLDWDDGHSFHPDERAIVFAVQRMSFVPLQLDPGFFAYGSLPLYVIRGVTSVLGWFEPAWRDDFATLVLTGRALSALAGVLAVWALFRLGARLFGRRTGLLAAFLLAACPLHVQCSHFLATDVTLTLFALLAVDACVSLADRRRGRDAAFAGAWTGLALATKVSAAPLVAPLAVALAIAFRRDRSLRLVGPALGALVLAALAGQPYAVLSFGEFWRQVSEQGAMVRHAGVLPYTIQYVGTPKYLYDAWQMAVWGMGPALGLAVLWAAGRTLFRLGRERTAPALVLAAWVVPFVLLTGAFDVKYPRYLLPVYPILILWAAAWLWDARGSRRGRVLLCAVPAATMLAALAFLAVYRGPHTSVAASDWVYRNLPEGATLVTQHWDEGFPLPLAGRGEPGRYRVVDFPFYEPDDDGKRDALARALAGADAVVLPTRRILGAVTRAPARFPMTNAFYQRLFAGRLGFTLVHEQSARPRLGPIEFADELADESLSVYDHPKVLVFRNVDRLSQEEIERRLAEDGVAPNLSRADLLRAGRAAPAPFGLVWGREPVRQGALALAWWALLLEGLSLSAYALLARWLPRLGGFALARVLGLLLLAWPAWWLAYAFERSFTPAVLMVLSAALLVAGAWAWRGRGWRWPAEAATVEALFWGAFAAFALVRAGNPAVFWGEKPMDFAFLNALTRVTALPPPEPWFAGSILQYTWFGHFVAAALGKACGIHPGVTFNLAIATVGALVVTSAFALGAIAGRSRRTGLAAAVLVALVGNLAGPLEWWWRRRGPFDSFWAASRVVRDTINEYPLWSVLFADLHAHLLVLPFTLAFLALLVAQARAPLGARTRPRLALMALLLGAVLVTNGWSAVTQPFLVPLLLVVLLPAALPRDARTLVTRVLAPGAIVGLGAVALFLPFWRTYQPPARNVGWERHSFAAFPEYALVFGLFLFISLPLLLRALPTRRARLGATGAVGLCALLSVLRPQWGAWRAGTLLLAGLGLWLACRRSEPAARRTAAGLTAAGLLLTAAADLVFLWDRMNTVFKLYLEAWLLLGAGSALALLATWRRLEGPAGQAWRAGVALLGLVAAVTGWQGAYAVIAQPRVASPRPTLDGTAYLADRSPFEAEAFEWLNAEVPGTPVIAEAWGDSYREFARVSMNTGLPALLGWDYHVHQRAHEWPAIDARKEDVARLYGSRDANEVRAVLDRHAVRYVYVGEVERRAYGADVGPRLLGFTELLRPAYTNAEVLILAATREGAAGEGLARVPPPVAAVPVTTPTPLPGLLREPRAVAVDDDGVVWVADFGNHRVQALSTGLEPLAAYGRQGPGAAEFEQPCALALAPGRVYVADTWNGRVQVLDRGGHMTSEWRGSYFGPRGIAVGPDGRVFLADTGNHRIRVFDPDGREVAAWGQRGSGPADLEEPMCVAVDTKERVHVCDNGNARVSVFDATGTPLRSFAVPGWQAGVYSEPKMALAPDGTIWLTVPLSGVVRAYGPDGRMLRELSGPAEGTPFRTPLGIAYDRRGPSLLVTDLENRVVRIPLGEPAR
jgi:YYY domain-containing protein